MTKNRETHGKTVRVGRSALSMRPFKQVKQIGKTVCFKCFEEDGFVNFFSRESWIKSAFSYNVS